MPVLRRGGACPSRRYALTIQVQSAAQSRHFCGFAVYLFRVSPSPRTGGASPSPTPVGDGSRALCGTCFMPQGSRFETRLLALRRGGRPRPPGRGTCISRIRPGACGGCSSYRAGRRGRRPLQQAARASRMSASCATRKPTPVHRRGESRLTRCRGAGASRSAPTVNRQGDTKSTSRAPHSPQHPGSAERGRLRD